MSAPETKSVISTWMVVDDASNATIFPQMGMNSSADHRVQSSYWKCVAVFFAVASRTSRPVHFRLYTNSANNISLAGPTITALLEKFDVEIAVVPQHHLPPPDYFGTWRNQFYILDIIDHISAEQDERRHVVTDSDCLFLRSLDGFFQAIERYGALTLDVGRPLGSPINGLTREDMYMLFRQMGNCDLSEPPLYFGGEIFAATSDAIRRMQPIAEKAWRDSLERANKGLSRLNEEAHLLTYVYYQLRLQPATANPFIKRLWTSRRFRNGVPEDALLPIIHLPGEKRFGYRVLYEAVKNSESWFYRERNNDRWLARIHATMSVPRPKFRRLASEVASSVMNRIERRIRGLVGR